MLTHYYESPQFIELLRNGPGGTHLDRFAEQLWQAGYSRITARRLVRAAQHLLYWADRKHIPLEDLDETQVRRFKRHLSRCRCHSFGRSDRSLIKGARLFVEYLRQGCIDHASRAKAIEPVPPPLLVEFQHWMRDSRNIGDGALYNYSLAVRDLLQTLGEDSRNFDAGRLRTFVLERSLQCGSSKAKTMGTALRMFIRFLIAEGECASGRGAAIPSFAQWHLCDLPRYLQPEEVERVIAACNPATAVGIRDRAIVLLLARLALRAGDVLQLRLEDIDWINAEIRVTGKGRRETHLPLSQEVGDAIVAYLTQGRPPADTDRLFVRSRAPLRGFACHSAISVIVAKAMHKAGVAPATRGAAHILRHSAATTMLRQGATMYDVAAVLRHRSIETTAIYAKVDINALREIAQPWPEVPSC